MSASNEFVVPATPEVLPSYAALTSIALATGEARPVDATHLRLNEGTVGYDLINAANAIGTRHGGSSLITSERDNHDYLYIHYGHPSAATAPQQHERIAALTAQGRGRLIIRVSDETQQLPSKLYGMFQRFGSGVGVGAGALATNEIIEATHNPFVQAAIGVGGFVVGVVGAGRRLREQPIKRARQLHAKVVALSDDFEAQSTIVPITMETVVITETDRGTYADPTVFDRGMELVNKYNDVEVDDAFGVPDAKGIHINLAHAASCLLSETTRNDNQHYAPAALAAVSRLVLAHKAFVTSRSVIEQERELTAITSTATPYLDGLEKVATTTRTALFDAIVEMAKLSRGMQIDAIANDAAIGEVMSSDLPPGAASLYSWLYSGLVTVSPRDPTSSETIRAALHDYKQAIVLCRRPVDMARVKHYLYEKYGKALSLAPLNQSFSHQFEATNGQ